MNCGHNYNLDYTIKLRYNRHDLKIENFHLLSTLSPPRLIGGRGDDEFKWSRV